MTTKGTKRRRRKTPGVSLIRPQEGSRTGWRVQYRDPEHGDKLRRETIPSAWAATEKTRIDYAARKCAELERERRRLAEGGTPNQHKPVEEAIREWVATYPAERTRESYGASVGLFAIWAGEHKIETLDDVVQSTLKSFRDDLYAQGKTATTRNRWLRANRTFLVWAIHKGYCPRLKEQELVALKKWQELREDPEPLEPLQVQAVFDAVARHDADVFHKARGRQEKPKYEPLIPMLMLCALAGLRRKEAVQLTWADYRKDALDVSGNRVGQITVPAAVAKTNRERRIPLDHSPALRAYLNRRLMETGGEGTLAGITHAQAGKAIARLRSGYGAPGEFDWQTMRVTASSYLTSAKSIFGASAHSQSASRLGHSWTVAEKHYAAAIAGIAGDATTLEAALQIEEHVTRACAGDTEANTFPLSDASRRKA